MITEPLEFEKPIVNLERQLAELRDRAADSDIDMSSEMKRIEDKLTKMKSEVYRNLSPWQRVQIARHTQRPFMLDYVEHSFDDFLELTAIATSAKTKPCPAVSPTSRAAASSSSDTRKAAIPRRISGATSVAPIPKATARPSAS